eukprot:CAMPEP_0183312524 /NCGR_PEP_ID=MMETSP0160_2-20130417/41945_1 /TAXON_ID=2839 ORGANISM="Odontella Sinensis, Strain Grunow 1884" /NCGR_SAMPLE_ID=MMETSP0160_2 /ASSEMBLY_ACC=CAM_ASM_000250 /LENGTH=36 /DNA_ID= /DNA_START= /DNA_END= /DNA_ORIENTATION=
MRARLVGLSLLFGKASSFAPLPRPTARSIAGGGGGG